MNDHKLAANLIANALFWQFAYSILMFARVSLFHHCNRFYLILTILCTI